MSLSYCIICTSTGTMPTAETCRIVPDDAFTEAEWDGMEDRSDTEIARTFPQLETYFDDDDILRLY